MKKFLVSILIFLAGCVCYAEDMKVMALNDISTDTPSEIKVQVLQTMKLDEGVILEQGTIVKGMMVDVVPPKRLKRDATFSFMPTMYTTPDKTTYKLNRKYVGKFSPKIEIDKGELAKTAALSVGDFFVKGLSTGFYAVQGAIKDEKGNRLVSSVNNVYENSLFSYISKGESIYIAAQSLFTFRFANPDPEESKYLGPAVIKQKRTSSKNVPGKTQGSLPVVNSQD